MTETCCRAASAARIDPASRRPIQRVLKIGGCQSTVCVHGPTLILQWPERRLETRRFLGRRPEFLAPCRTVVILRHDARFHQIRWRRPVGGDLPRRLSAVARAADVATPPAGGLRLGWLGLTEGKAPGHKPGHLGRRFRLRHQPPDRAEEGLTSWPM